MQENLVMNQDEFETHLNELTDMVIRQQGIQFDSIQEAQRYKSETTCKLKRLLLQNNTMFVEGLKYLIESDTQPVAEIARKIYAHLDSPNEVAEIIEAEIIKNKDSLKLFSEAVNMFYGCGDFHIEECVLSVLLTLFPMEPQPFACYGTMIWRKDGIAEAVSYYKKIVDMFESPVLDYFAADCYYKSDDKVEAKKILDRAMKNIQESPDTYDDIGQFIRILLKQL